MKMASRTKQLVIATQMAVLACLVAPLTVGAEGGGRGSGGSSHARSNITPRIYSTRSTASSGGFYSYNPGHLPQYQVSPLLYRAVTGQKYPSEYLNTGAKLTNSAKTPSAKNLGPTNARVQVVPKKNNNNPILTGPMEYYPLPQPVPIYHSSLASQISSVSEAYLLTCSTSCPVEYHPIRHYYAPACG